MSQEGLNEFQTLQVKAVGTELGKEVIATIEKHFVDRVEYTKTTSRQNIKIYTIYGILTFLGLGGALGLYKLIA